MAQIKINVDGSIVRDLFSGGDGLQKPAEQRPNELLATQIAANNLR